MADIPMPMDHPASYDEHIPVPDCVSGSGHDWQRPHQVVGGLEANPGVRGHGGGVVITEVCAHCGIFKVTDTWASDPATGEQGVWKVTYRYPTPESVEWVDSVAGRPEM